MPGVSAGATWFQRFLLPGFAFKAVVIGGGYATGRELAEFFLPSGPWGGIAAMLLATVIWSAVCVVTFVFARMRKAAAWLMVPYMAWISFAGMLTLGIDRLNPNAETLVPHATSTKILL